MLLGRPWIDTAVMQTSCVPQWIMTTFMLQGARVRDSGRVGELMLVVTGEAQVLVPDGSGKTPVDEPDKS
jgi:hypothetical protein